MAPADAAEFDAFVAARSAVLFRTAVLLCGGDRAAAADAVQDTMLEVWRRWRRIRVMERADGYAHRILVTHALRGRRRTMRLVVTDEPPDLPSVGTATATDERHDLMEVLRRLPPMQRAVVVLRYYEDLSEAQTAHLLDISVGTVKSHASRALTSLRLRLPESYATGGGHD
jgi:RNA polymerase sigma-70 factor (sigma-E family)